MVSATTSTQILHASLYIYRIIYPNQNDGSADEIAVFPPPTAIRFAVGGWEKIGWSRSRKNRSARGSSFFFPRSAAFSPQIDPSEPSFVSKKLAILRFQYIVDGVCCTSTIPSGAEFALEQNHYHLDPAPGVYVTSTPFAPCRVHRDCFVAFAEDQVAGEDAAQYCEQIEHCNLILVARDRKYVLHARREILPFAPLVIHTRIWKKVGGRWKSRHPLHGTQFQNAAVPPLVYQP